LNKEARAKYDREYNRTHKKERAEYTRTHKKERAEYLRKNRSKILERDREYNRLHKEERLKYFREYCRTHKKETNKYSVEYKRALRVKVLRHYGNGKLACVRCGFDDRRALSIDHINGNGAEHRRALTEEISVWLTARNYPLGFQTLCMNCQFIKMAEDREMQKGAALC